MDMKLNIEIDTLRDYLPVDGKSMGEGSSIQILKRLWVWSGLCRCLSSIPDVRLLFKDSSTSPIHVARGQEWDFFTKMLGKVGTSDRILLVDLFKKFCVGKGTKLTDYENAIKIALKLKVKDLEKGDYWIGLPDVNIQHWVRKLKMFASALKHEEERKSSLNQSGNRDEDEHGTSSLVDSDVEVPEIKKKKKKKTKRREMTIDENAENTGNTPSDSETLKSFGEEIKTISDELEKNLNISIEQRVIDQTKAKIDMLAGSDEVDIVKLKEEFVKSSNPKDILKLISKEAIQELYDSLERDNRNTVADIQDDCSALLDELDRYKDLENQKADMKVKLTGLNNLISELEYECREKVAIYNTIRQTIINTSRMCYSSYYGPIYYLSEMDRLIDEMYRRYEDRMEDLIRGKLRPEEIMSIVNNIFFESTIDCSVVAQNEILREKCKLHQDQIIHEIRLMVGGNESTNEILRQNRKLLQTIINLLKSDRFELGEASPYFPDLRDSASCPDETSSIRSSASSSVPKPNDDMQDKTPTTATRKIQRPNYRKYLHDL